MRPNFIVIGAAKCGTTSLCDTLARHPDVFMTDPKEPRYFSFDRHYERGPEWYESLFEGSEPYAARGEGSQSYTVSHLFPHSAARIHAYDSRMKLIYMVRHPLEKIESTWLEVWTWSSLQRRYFPETDHLGRRDLFDRDFNRAVRESTSMLVDSANYLRELGRYRDLFPEEQILVIFFEEFVRDERAVLGRCFEFLRVDGRAEIELDPKKQNRSVGKWMPRRAYARLRSAPVFSSIHGIAVDLLPERVQRKLSEMFLRTPVVDRPRWDPEVKGWVVDLLRDDVERFLRSVDRPPDFWDLTSSEVRHGEGSGRESVPELATASGDERRREEIER